MLYNIVSILTLLVSGHNLFLKDTKIVELQIFATIMCILTVILSVRAGNHPMITIIWAVSALIQMETSYSLLKNKR